MKAVNNLLMLLIAMLVLWSLVGVSVKQAGGESSYSLFIKAAPTMQVLYPEMEQ
ncbi:MAG: hypothetical protein SOX43_03115 [Pelistega sp.]|nr:hypothetical protein [Pelistega sp.]